MTWLRCACDATRRDATRRDVRVRAFVRGVGQPLFCGGCRGDADDGVFARVSHTGVPHAFPGLCGCVEYLGFVPCESRAEGLRAVIGAVWDDDDARERDGGDVWAGERGQMDRTRAPGVGFFSSSDHVEAHAADI